MKRALSRYKMMRLTTRWSGVGKTNEPGCTGEGGKSKENKDGKNEEYDV